jgi:hypothetical protein
MILELYAYAPIRVGHEIEDLAMPVDTSANSEDCNCYIVRAAARHVTHHCDHTMQYVVQSGTGIRRIEGTARRCGFDVGLNYQVLKSPTYAPIAAFRSI